jgi:hypothetical protein
MFRIVGIAAILSMIVIAASALYDSRKEVDNSRVLIAQSNCPNGQCK